MCITAVQLSAGSTRDREAAHAVRPIRPQYSVGKGTARADVDPRDTLARIDKGELGGAGDKEFCHCHRPQPAAQSPQRVPFRNVWRRELDELPPRAPGKYEDSVIYTTCSRVRFAEQREDSLV